MTIPAGFTLIPRVTDVRNGKFRPEIVIAYRAAATLCFSRLSPASLRAA